MRWGQSLVWLMSCLCIWQPWAPTFLSMDVDGRIIRTDSFSKILSSGWASESVCVCTCLVCCFFFNTSAREALLLWWKILLILPQHSVCAFPVTSHDLIWKQAVFFLSNLHFNLLFALPPPVISYGSVSRRQLMIMFIKKDPFVAKYIICIAPCLHPFV